MKSIVVNSQEEKDSNNFPPFLYKYRSMKRLKEILTDFQLYFSPVEDFNDPFEFKMIVSDEMKESLIDYIIRTTSSENHLPKGMKKIKNLKLSTLASDSIAWMWKEWGVFTCSEVNNSILMWSHYADSHKGVCIEFDVSMDWDFFKNARRVQYSNDYIKCPLIRYKGLESKELRIDNLNSSLYCKFTDWSYEKEYRIVKSNFAKGLKSINPNAIKSIIVGCKILDNDLCDIKTILKNKTELQHVQLKRCVIDDNKYKLNIVDVPLDNCPTTDP